MKYHTLSTSNVSGETKTSGFTLYADIGISQNKQISYSEMDMKKIREQLENVQNDLKIQTKRCRHLVAQYTKKLQEKEQLYRSEKALRDTQLAKVLKALLIFEARLRQEQKLISHQLNEKDYIINSQTNDIKKLLASQYCKNCNQYYSFDSSSEYVATEQEYQSSNLESLDSSSETCVTSERDCPSRSESDTYEKIGNNKNLFQKNRYSSQGRRKVAHRKSTGTYFEVLKLRNDSSLSNEDNTSADYDHLDSLPPESITDKISVVSENIENMLNNSRNLGSNSESSTNISSSECDKTVINKIIKQNDQESAAENKINEDGYENKLLTDTIPVFESGGDANDNWYASASDQEDEDHRDMYKNNPVLECMNQILLQNINDINSPPKTPNTERKNNKNNKRVKFSDEENNRDEKNDYYETPIQKTPNFYETPQSIYSNDYEQIMSKSSEGEASETHTFESKTSESNYIEMEHLQDSGPLRKSKILRIPPALPPKPPNLVSKCKINILPKKPPSENSSTTDLEPDYCSISELNLPQSKVVCGKKISVVAEVHSPTSNDIKNRLNNHTLNDNVLKISNEEVKLNEEKPSLVVKKCVEKLNIQLAKQTLTANTETSPKKKAEMQIPKLPQVSEIIIPDDPEENEETEAMISQDNYIKNNTQMMQSNKKESSRKPIMMGSSVSSLINGFNNQFINEIKKKHERLKPDSNSMFSSFENIQNLDKRLAKTDKSTPETPSFENFDLSQNFEEFKLDDCEIEEYDVEGELDREEKLSDPSQNNNNSPKNTNRVDYIRATDMALPKLNQTSIEILKKQLEIQQNQNPHKDQQNNESKKIYNQHTYEHFLECTGLSSKSILTPSRLLSNHKHMLKPKDVKLRSKVRSTNGNLFEKHGGSKVKYWSEPFV